MGSVPEQAFTTPPKGIAWSDRGGCAATLSFVRRLTYLPRLHRKAALPPSRRNLETKLGFDSNPSFQNEISTKHFAGRR